LSVLFGAVYANTVPLAKIPLQSKYEHPRFTMSNVRRLKLSYQRIPSPAPFTVELVHESLNLFLSKWHWRLHEQLLFPHVKYALRSWQ